LSMPAPSLAMPAHGPPKRGHFSAILAGFLFELSRKEIISNYENTKSKEEKNIKNGSQKNVHRGQSGR